MTYVTKIMRLNNCTKLLMAVSVVLVLSHCADAGKKKQWDNIDYSKVRNRGSYENDQNYRLPSVSSCTDDDLYNCN